MRRYANLLAVLALSTNLALHAQTNELVIQTKKLGAEIQPTMYGLFFEDINYAADGGLYPTRTRISQWERLLDDRFIRIHRAWLVNAERVSRVTMTDVTIERVTLEVSRKYRNAVAERFGLHKPAR